MSGIVLDTMVFSELMRGRDCDPVMRAWIETIPGDEQWVSAITVGEIYVGLGLLPEGKRKRELSQAAQEVFEVFSERVLPFDTAAAERYGAVYVQRKAAGARPKEFDCQIAAICSANGKSLATRNVKDFTATGVTVINPWKPVT